MFFCYPYGAQNWFFWAILTQPHPHRDDLVTFIQYTHEAHYAHWHSHTHTHTYCKQTHTHTHLNVGVESSSDSRKQVYHNLERKIWCQVSEENKDATTHQKWPPYWNTAWHSGLLLMGGKAICSSFMPWRKPLLFDSDIVPSLSHCRSRLVLFPQLETRDEVLQSPISEDDLKGAV